MMTLSGENVPGTSTTQYGVIGWTNPTARVKTISEPRENSRSNFCFLEVKHSLHKLLDMAEFQDTSIAAIKKFESLVPVHGFF